MGAHLDTSGVVHSHKTDPATPRVLLTHWSDLTPFTQGYMEAMPWTSDDMRTKQVGTVQVHVQPLGFRDLAPETLARIIEDCERVCGSLLGGRNPITAADRDLGREFSETRRGYTVHLRGNTFPPLTPYLGDDGKVYLREAGR